MKLLLLDLDGTVRETKSGATFINDPHDQKLIDGVEEAIACYHDWTIVAITNQGGVAAGHKSFQDTYLEQIKTMELAPWIEVIFFCPNDGSEAFMVDKTLPFEPFYQAKNRFAGQYRKPKPGMILEALDIWKPDTSLMVGDRPEDEQAAIAAGVDFMWADQWRRIGDNVPKGDIKNV